MFILSKKMSKKVNKTTKLKDLKSPIIVELAVSFETRIAYPNLDTLSKLRHLENIKFCR